jgi:hypothetical protein
MNAGGPFVRYSMAGWVFLIVLAASVALSANQIPWKAFTLWLSHPATASEALGSIAAAAFGIIAGVSAPPALGYVLTRAAASLVSTWRSFLVWQAIGKIRNRLRHPSIGQVWKGPRDYKAIVKAWKNHLRSMRKFDGKGGVLHARFYGHANQTLIDWRVDRVIAMDASLSCALAGLAALFVAATVFRATALGVTIMTIFLTVLLIADGWYEDHKGEAARDAWLRDYLSGKTEPGQEGSHPAAVQPKVRA